jgi:integrase
MRAGKLSDLAVRRAKPGMHGDGGNLWLQVTGDAKRPARSWLFRFGRDGRERYMGLGPYPDVALQEARDKAQDARRLLREGKDPIEVKRSNEAAAALALAKGMTFRQCAEAYIEAHKDSWKNAKHAAQWPSTLEAYAHPVFGDLPVQAIDVALVMKAVEPIWRTRTETASRLRGRIEAVLDWATVRGSRQGENPARWRGHLDHLLPERSKVQKVRHHPALAYTEIGEFMSQLTQQEGASARALEFAILTAGRTNEIIGATWQEIALGERAWTIPAARMKSGKEHRVPVSVPALAILEGLAKTGKEGFIFPGGKFHKPLSSMALLMVLRRMGRKDLTVHGFRSTFRDWAAERTNFAREVAEMALAHSVSDKVEAAYRRGDLFEKRRKLMDAWASYCAKPAVEATVVAIPRRA